jgi:radical SAM superfamily enzyme YgiQ (UPF0313 family)
VTPTPRRVLLVGFEDQDNLGIRYLSSRLLADGHHTRIAVFNTDAAPLLEIIEAEQPDVVGFSLIFQYMVPEFASVIRALRAAGVEAHLTIGGHYASFAPEELLRMIPELDSVVRFEGEETLAELVACLADDGWRSVAGIAWHSGESVQVNVGRQGSRAIDDFPDPDRRDIDYRHKHFPTASVLASRGCPWQCTFCSIITFYEGNGTKGRRRRDPTRVVDEVEYLVRERGAVTILFQDDDFLAGGPAARRWACDVAGELVRRGLHDEMRYKISCRSDELRPELLGPLVESGLCHVYLGVESGEDQTLLTLNKLMEADAHRRAARLLREFDLTFDFGYMLMEPWSTIDSVRGSSRFLREFTADGWTVAGFCRTLPYVGTPVEHKLRAEGRLTGPALEADYRFLDQRLDLFWDFCQVAFDGRNSGPYATWNLLRGMLFDTHFDLPSHRRDPARHETAQALTRASNTIMLDVVDGALDLIEHGDATGLDDPNLLALAQLAHREDKHIRELMMLFDSPESEDVYEALFR